MTTAAPSQRRDVHARPALVLARPRLPGPAAARAAAARAPQRPRPRRRASRTSGPTSSPGGRWAACRSPCSSGCGAAACPPSRSCTTTGSMVRRHVDGWQRGLARRSPRARRLVGALTGVPSDVDLERAARYVFVSESHPPPLAGRRASPPFPAASASSGIDPAFLDPAPRAAVAVAAALRRPPSTSARGWPPRSRRSPSCPRPSCRSSASGSSASAAIAVATPLRSSRAADVEQPPPPRLLRERGRERRGRSPTTRSAGARGDTRLVSSGGG